MSSFQFPIPENQQQNETSEALWGLFESAIGFGTASSMRPNRMSVRSYKHGLTPGKSDHETEIVDLQFRVEFFQFEDGLNMKVSIEVSRRDEFVDRLEEVIETGFGGINEVVKLHRLGKRSILTWREGTMDFEENVSKHSSKFWDFDPRIGYSITTDSPLFDNPFWERDDTGGSTWYGGLYGWIKKKQ